LGKIFIIDIDGCICEHVDNEHPELMLSAKPYPDSIRKINEWYDEGTSSASSPQEQMNIEKLP